MSRPLAVGLALSLVVLPVAADDSIPAKTLADIKAATVFVKIETARATGSGSGFVMKVMDTDTVLVVTNDHVVHPPPALGAVRKLDVVFRSGKKDEAVLSAEVLAADAERDLAVLKVKKVPDPPAPLDLTAKAELSETMTVYTLGFPFGEALATSKGNPAMTVGKGSVSSLRENDEGELAFVQIDGDINPGNSGGPVVDAKGQLVGVAVAKVKGTNIGLAIPPQELTKMLNGRLGAAGVRVVSADKETAEIEITLQFIDPLEKVSSATVRLVKTDAPPPKAGKGGEIPELKGGTTHEVKVSGQKGTIKLKLPIAKHQMQVVYSNEGRKDIRTGLAVQDVPTMVSRLTVASGGTPETPDPRGGTPLPKPGNPLTEGRLGSGDPKVRSVVVSTDSKATRGAPPCLTWTDDAKGFYALDHGKQAVRRYSFPELKEEAAVEVGKACSWLCLSKEGVVVTVSGDQEAWVLDPKTLEKVSTFPVAKASRVLSAPSLSVAYVCDSSEYPIGPGWFRVADLKTGKTLKEYEVKTLTKTPGSLSPVISADGKRLYALGGEQIVQYALDGEKITFVAASDRLVYGAFNQPNVSADGKLMAAPCGAGNFPPKGSTKKLTGALVFSTENLTDPVIELKTGSPSALGFDVKAGLIYGHAWEEKLVVMDREGSVLKSFKIADGAGNYPNQFLVHPDGWKLLLMVPGGRNGAEATVYAVELSVK